MSSRWYLPYVGVIALGAVVVAFSTYGFLTLAGVPGLSAGSGRFVLGLFLLLGICAVIVPGIDMYRQQPRQE